MSNVPKQRNIFYSWQSDLPNPTNRGLIRSALDQAVKDIVRDGSIHVEPRIEQDTSGEPGSPEIFRTILEKIDRADALVFDVSLVDRIEGREASPNPNVLIELGYAYKAHQSERVLLVMNTHFGPPEVLPFDLRGKRVISYVAAPSDEDRSVARKKLRSHLKNGILDILKFIEKQERHSEAQIIGVSAGEQLEELIADEKNFIELRKFVGRIIRSANQRLSPPSFPTYPPLDGEGYVRRMKMYKEAIDDLLTVTIRGCFYGKAMHDELWALALKRISDPDPEEIPSGGRKTNLGLERFRYFPASLIMYAASMAYLERGRYEPVRSLLLDVIVNKKLLGREPAALALQHCVLLAPGGSRLFEEIDGSQYPLVDRIEQLLRPYFEDLIDDPREYELLFDRFEYLLNLVCADATGSELVSFPGGLYTWRHKYRSTPLLPSDAKDSLLKAGFFEGKSERLNHVAKIVDQYIQ